MRDFHSTSLVMKSGLTTTLLKLTSGGNALKIKPSDIQASNQILKKLKAVAKAKSVNIK